jgi:hypothetical protein
MASSDRFHAELRVELEGKGAPVLCRPGLKFLSEA